MASPSKSGSQKHEIVARHDGYCCLCRGKTFAGARIWWDGSTGLVHHVECPPATPLAEEVYRPPPVTPGRWKELCKQIVDAMTGGDSVREVTSVDVEAEACGAFGGMLVSVLKRTRCTGHEAVEIVRRWKDKQQPEASGEECVDWDAEGEADVRPQQVGQMAGGSAQQ